MRITPGRPYPLGATVTPDGVNFAVFSRHATALYLELFDEAHDTVPRASFGLHPKHNRTGDVWHTHVQGIGSGQLYGVRADGPYDPAGTGHRFNVNKLLIDPYARALQGRIDLDHDAVYGYDRSCPCSYLRPSTLDSAGHMPRCVVLADEPFDWQGARRPGRALEHTVIYEMHVRGYTVDHASGVAHRGTYRGLVEKVDHLRSLGVTAVELLPVHEFGGGEPVGHDPKTGRPLRNYWGYNTLAFFAPERRYAVCRDRGEPVREFKEMVRALHAAGIEVILDVVFNHTGEGHELGPTLSFRGLDNVIYYLLDDKGRYRNYAGTGNTLNCNHPVLKQLILDSLRYWAVEMHVDGFRFDLATILGRDRRGEWIGDLSLLYDIGGDPVLRGCKLIAEAWDADGMYKVGGFPRGWAEWNGRFRDDLRRFWRGDPGLTPAVARRLGGSRDLFGDTRTPAHSINFITCHDGFTLRDLVSYERKHNERNGEENRDGTDDNAGRNWGVEGETDDPGVRALRLRQGKNFLVSLMLARGTPMLLSGDELWHTQGGNNNAYCQDNPTSWLGWGADDEAREMLRFCRLLVAFRSHHAALRRPCFVDPLAVAGGGDVGQVGTDITWHGVEPGRPDWSYASHTLALRIHGTPPPAARGYDDTDIYVAFSAWERGLRFRLPALPGDRCWRRVIDTALPPPADIMDETTAPVVREEAYLVGPHTAVVLVAGPNVGVAR